MEMRFLSRIKGKPRLDRIGNETYRGELKDELIEETIQHTMNMVRTRYYDGGNNSG